MKHNRAAAKATPPQSNHINRRPMKAGRTSSTARRKSDNEYEMAARRCRLREIMTISSAADDSIRNMYRPNTGRYCDNSALLSHCAIFHPVFSKTARQSNPEAARITMEFTTYLPPLSGSRGMK